MSTKAAFMPPVVIGRRMRRMREGGGDELHCARAREGGGRALVNVRCDGGVSEEEERRGG